MLFEPFRGQAGYLQFARFLKEMRRSRNDFKVFHRLLRSYDYTSYLLFT